MMEPLSVAVHSVSSLGKLKSGQNVIVFGAGPVGLLIMAVAKALGAKKIVAVDINEERLKFAKGYAATHTFVPVSLRISNLRRLFDSFPLSQPPPEKDESRPDYSQRVAGLVRDAAGLEVRGGDAIDLVLEASGAEVCCQIGIHIVKPG
jgi:D-xylulose reductase